MNLVLSDSFLDSVDRLDRQSRNVVKVAMFDLQSSPQRPGFRLEKIKGNGNLWSGRINQNLRLILDRSHSPNIVLYVDKHDKAYAWASTHKLQQNKGSGALQLINLEQITERPAYTQQVAQQPRYFERYSDDYLLKQGVPEEWLIAVKQASTDDDLSSLIDNLPDEACERLLRLNEGQLLPDPSLANDPPLEPMKSERPNDLTGKDSEVPEEDLHDEKSAQETVPLEHTGDSEPDENPSYHGDPLYHPDTLRHFVHIENQDDLTKALNSPWAKWTVFLHPDQRTLVDQSFPGTIKLSGPAGTGKTVVALHRAFRLATENPASSVLLTTYSRTLSDRLKEMVRTLAGSSNLIPNNLTIINIHSLALRIWGRQNNDIKFSAVNENRIRSMLDAASKGTPISIRFSLRFLLSEWINVIDYWGVETLEDYLRAGRPLRGTRLTDDDRRGLWSIFGPVLNDLAKSPATMTWPQLSYAAIDLVESGQGESYEHIVVDEVQDFGPAEIRLVREMTKIGSDDLFLCGDANQRIYVRGFDWNSLGVQIRGGRSKRLSVNYRNTQQIQEYGKLALLGASVGGDGESEDQNAISRFRGEKPIIQVCDDERSEIETLSQWLADLIDGGYKPSEVGILCRQRSALNEIVYSAINKIDGLKWRDLEDTRSISSPAEAVWVGTMHRSKGLEFRAIALVGCNEKRIPDPLKMADACDDLERESVLDEERHLIYAAMTRPREQLLVTCAGQLSDLIPSDPTSESPSAFSQ